MAVATFTVLRWMSRLDAGPGSGAAAVVSTVLGETAVTLGSVLQWVIPPLLVFGAAVSFRWRRRRGPKEQADGEVCSIEPGRDAGVPKAESPRLPPAGSSVPDARPPAWSIEVLRAMEWKHFADLCAAYYRHLGLRVLTVQCGADGGIDARITRGEGMQPCAVLQCKAWGSRSVGVKTVRELLGVMTQEGVDTGVLLITGEFTDGATEFAKSHRIALGTGEQFLKKVRSLPADVQRHLLEVACAGEWTIPSCPGCGTKMVEREGGSRRFWGCASTPPCRQTFLMRGVA